MTELVGAGIDYRRAGRQILAGVDVRAVAGEVLVVTGPSGSGKSSLLAVLAGLEPPTAGTVTLDGARVRVGDVAVRRRMGLVLQGYGLVSVLTAAENVELVLQARGLPAAECLSRAAAALARVGLADVADHLTEELSGGQQQRVAIARALVGEPDVLLADEPTAELDAANRELVLELLLAEARAGRTVVLASHDPEVADACDRELHLVDGRVDGWVDGRGAGRVDGRVAGRGAGWVAGRVDGREAAVPVTERGSGATPDPGHPQVSVPTPLTGDHHPDLEPAEPATDSPTEPARLPDLPPAEPEPAPDSRTVGGGGAGGPGTGWERPAPPG